jgi:hypothetical protein
VADWHASLGLALCLVVLLIVKYLPVHETSKRSGSTAPSPLANRKPGLVKCGVAQPNVPAYMRSAVMRTRAHDLATSVANGKRLIVAHMIEGDVRRCSPSCRIRTIIAGVVRDRRELKKIGYYDQPF